METKPESKYERLRKIGIGSYGVVFKCVNRQSGQIVAIKRYSENDSDPIIRKIAMREVRMLRQLKHPNLINLIEVFRRKRRLHLVFDYCELTVLDVIDKYAQNCPLNLMKKIVWQTVNGIDYCHSRNCIHRDIKPENILINQSGVVKLCDFGFARSVASSGASSNGIGSQRSQNGSGGSSNLGSGGSSSTNGSLAASRYQSLKREACNILPAALNGKGSNGNNKENWSLADSSMIDFSLNGSLWSPAADRQALTEYVATRWYRAPELLIGETYYDTKIDIWAIGCVTAELMRGEPIWPGKTDLDQLCIIKSSLGQLTARQTHTLLSQSIYDQASTERLLNQSASIGESLERKLPARVAQSGIDFVTACLQMDPARRPTSDELLRHGYIHSVRMVQFMRQEPAATATGFAGEHLSAGTVAASNGQRQQQQQATSQTASGPDKSLALQRSNSQSLLLAATAQPSQQPAESSRQIKGQNGDSPAATVANVNGTASPSLIPSLALSTPPNQAGAGDRHRPRQQQQQQQPLHSETTGRQKRKQSINSHANGLTAAAAAAQATEQAGGESSHKSLVPTARFLERANFEPASIRGAESTTPPNRAAIQQATVAGAVKGSSSRRSKRESLAAVAGTKQGGSLPNAARSGSIGAIPTVQALQLADYGDGDNGGRNGNNKHTAAAHENNNQLGWPDGSSGGGSPARGQRSQQQQPRQVVGRSKVKLRVGQDNSEQLLRSPVVVGGGRQRASKTKLATVNNATGAAAAANVIDSSASLRSELLSARRLVDKSPNSTGSFLPTVALDSPVSQQQQQQQQLKQYHQLQSNVGRQSPYYGRQLASKKLPPKYGGHQPSEVKLQQQQQRQLDGNNDAGAHETLAHEHGNSLIPIKM